jgi:hypothetical protein
LSRKGFEKYEKLTELYRSFTSTPGFEIIFIDYRFREKDKKQSKKMNSFFSKNNHFNTVNHYVLISFDESLKRKMFSKYQEKVDLDGRFPCNLIILLV